MIIPMKGKVVIKKVSNESTIKGIFMTTTSDNNYKIVNILEDEQLKINDVVVVSESKLFKVIDNGEEFAICDISDILAVIK